MKGHITINTISIISKYMDLSQFTTINNKDKNRFELRVQEHLGRIDYIINKTELIFLVHVEVDRKLQGMGVATKMLQDVFYYIEQQNMKMVPLCPFIASYLKRHPEYQYLLAKGYHI